MKWDITLTVTAEYHRSGIEADTEDEAIAEAKDSIRSEMGGADTVDFEYVDGVESDE